MGLRKKSQFVELLEFVIVIVSGMLLLCMVQGDVHHYEFVLTKENFTRLCVTKGLLVINGTLPGPVIRVHKGDTVYVNVHNQGPYSFTIHWHGVKQPRNSWSDGPEYITQCPIQPGANFTYEVIFSKEEGTLWWHAHSDWTRNSVHGAIVVLPARGTTYPFPEPDEDEVLVLGSWYDSPDVNGQVAQDLITGQDVPISNSYLINGQPGDFVVCSAGSAYRRVVDHGKTYLLRIVSAVMNVELFFAIAGHNLTVVGMDGNYLKPFTTPYIMISPGQTMDVLLVANQSLGRYYMATRQYDSVKEEEQDFDKQNVTAILEYRGNYTPPANPIFPSTLPSFMDFMAADRFLARLRSLASPDHPVDVPLNVTTRMFLVASMNQILCADHSCKGIHGNKLSASINNISFRNPTTDVLLAYYRNISGFYTSDFPDQPGWYYNFTADEFPFNVTVADPGTKVKMLNYNETVEVIFQGTNVLQTSESHPMHLHGYSFYVVGSGYGNFDPENDPKGYNLVDPPELTTVSVHKEGWATIRFVASNPGVWYWHCHFDRHLSWGMSTVFIVKNGDTPETSLLEPPANMPSCQQVTFPNWIQEFEDPNGEENKSKTFD
uniref:Laccase n=1 Tax=Davidia involucrata TaxID=16924 RepID=A0A5B7AIK0_DAVIN